MGAKTHLWCSIRLGGLGQSQTAFQQAFHPRNNNPLINLLTQNISWLFKASFPYQQTKQQNQFNFWRPSCGLVKSTSPTDFTSPLLKYPEGFRFGGETQKWGFPFLKQKIATKSEWLFIVLRTKPGVIRFRNFKWYFSVNASRKQPTIWRPSQELKRQNRQMDVCCKQSANQNNLINYRSPFSFAKSKSSHRPVQTQIYDKMWTFYFGFGRPCLDNLQKQKKLNILKIIWETLIALLHDEMNFGTFLSFVPTQQRFRFGNFQDRVTLENTESFDNIDHFAQRGEWKQCPLPSGKCKWLRFVSAPGHAVSRPWHAGWWRQSVGGDEQNSKQW